MALIVEEEKTQLIELRDQTEESDKNLDLLKEDEEFTRQNENLKKEIEKAQNFFKITKQSKYRRDLLDFEKGQIFALTICRGRSGSSRRAAGSHSRNRKGGSPFDQGEENSQRTVTFLEKEGIGGGASHIPLQGDPQSQKTHPETSQRGKPQKSGRGGYRTRSQNQRVLGPLKKPLLRTKK